jgi:hypothetical protein
VFAAQGAQPQDFSPSLRLAGWCTSTGLLSELAAGALLVLGMKPDPWVQEGPDGAMNLLMPVFGATSVARRVQVIVAQS